MEYSAADGHHFRTHEEIALARPASMRVEAIAPFGATMVLAADDAGRLMIFDPSKNRSDERRRERRDARALRANPARRRRPRSICLLGLAPDPARTADAARLGQR